MSILQPYRSLRLTVFRCLMNGLYIPCAKCSVIFKHEQEMLRKYYEYIIILKGERRTGRKRGLCLSF